MHHSAYISSRTSFCVILIYGAVKLVSTLIAPLSFATRPGRISSISRSCPCSTCRCSSGSSERQRCGHGTTTRGTLYVLFAPFSFRLVLPSTVKLYKDGPYSTCFSVEELIEPGCGVPLKLTEFSLFKFRSDRARLRSTALVNKLSLIKFRTR
jgi:hypothetical protein